MTLERATLRAEAEIEAWLDRQRARLLSSVSRVPC